MEVCNGCERLHALEEAGKARRYEVNFHGVFLAVPGTENKLFEDLAENMHGGAASWTLVECED